MVRARTALSARPAPLSPVFPLRSSRDFEEPLTAWRTEPTAAPSCLPVPT
ncbi:hypothetical protein EDD94_4839 [Streptomyces sp. PanSC9]|nr:hypothetical protein EDD94_4839 [Streptomyces sp. PanSC9]